MREAGNEEWGLTRFGFFIWDLVTSACKFMLLYSSAMYNFLHVGYCIAAIVWYCSMLFYNSKLQIKMNSEK